MNRKQPVITLVLALLGVWFVTKQFGHHLRLPLSSRTCTVQADGEVVLSAEQMANAATIAAIGVQRKMPERAVVVALATAYQESHLRNIAHGDRDSLGLFQQRPSQGWGTPEQVLDPVRAAAAFYGGPSSPTVGTAPGLLDVDGWESLSLTQAAQAVQRSAHPDHYAKWETQARAWLAELG